MTHTNPRRPLALSFAAVIAAGVLFLSACAPTATAPPADEDTTATQPADDTGTDDGADDDTDADADVDIAAVVGAGQELRVRDASQSVVECDGGGEVYVEYAGPVVVTGVCNDIDIVADGAQVTLDSASEVDVDSSGNTVVAMQIGELDILGNDNTVTVQNVSDIDVEGSGNTVIFGGSPDIDDTGSGNTLTRS